MIELTDIGIEAKPVRSFDQPGKFLERLYLCFVLFRRRSCMKELGQDGLLGELCDLEQKSMLVALPCVVLTDDIIDALDLVFACEVPLL